MLPEVVGLAEAEDVLFGNADDLVPDLKGLIVIQVDRGIQAVLLQAHHFRQELPAERNGLVLEVIAEGEVAQHLKVGAVAISLADVLNVAGTDALLAGGDTVPGRLLLPGEPGLHGGHAAVDQQQGLVVGGGDQGKAGQTKMALALKVAQEHLPQFVQPVIGMCHLFLPPMIFLRILLKYSRDRAEATGAARQRVFESDFFVCNTKKPSPRFRGEGCLFTVPP